MKKIAIIVPRDMVILRLEKYLAKRGYKQVQIDYKAGEIRAIRRKNFFLNNEHVLLRVQHASNESTNIELTLNPHQEKKSPIEENREVKLRNKIISYL